MIEIPVADVADQEFGVILDGRRCSFRLRFNETAQRWSFDFSLDDQPILTARRIVVGRDLFEGLRLGLGVLFALGEGEPDRASLPSGRVRLYYASVSDVAALSP